MRSLKDILYSSVIPAKQESLWLKPDAESRVRMFTPTMVGWKEVFLYAEAEIKSIKKETFSGSSSQQNFYAFDTNIDDTSTNVYSFLLGVKAGNTYTTALVTADLESRTARTIKLVQNRTENDGEAIEGVSVYKYDGKIRIIIRVPALTEEFGTNDVDITAASLDNQDILKIVESHSGTRIIVSSITEALTKADLTNYMPKSGGTFTGDVNIDEGDLYVKGRISVENGEILMTDDPTSDMAAINKGYVDNSLSEKQDTLVSGTNIKTINNTSLLGSGNIQISADTSNCVKFGETINASNVYLTIYGDETFALMLIVVLDDEVSTYIVRGNQSPTVSVAKIEGVDSFQYAKRDYENGTLALYHEDSLTVTPILLSGTMPTITDLASSSGDKEEIPYYLDSNSLKTINNTSLLGSGNIPVATPNDLRTKCISAGSGGDSLFILLAGESDKYYNGFRIDMAGKEGDSEDALTGSLLVTVHYDENTLAHWHTKAYYYGVEISRLIDNVAIYEDDGNYYLAVTFANMTYRPINCVVTSLSNDEPSLSSVEIYEQTLIGTITPTVMEQSSNKVSTISGNETNTTKYPNTKAVADALGKIGVISHDIKYNVDGNVVISHTITNAVNGLIPQAFIDKWKAMGGTFTDGGYFSMNGIDDMSYEDALAVDAAGILTTWTANSFGYFLMSQSELSTFDSAAGVIYKKVAPRTMYPMQISGIPANSGSVYFFLRFSPLEVLKAEASMSIRANTTNNYFCSNAKRLRRIENITFEIDQWTSQPTGLFNLTNIEYIQFTKLAYSMNLSSCPAFSAEAVAYMIANAGTATITITLHATAYARANADADVQAALSAHTNVSLQSA